jgi:hypothetical protein
MKNANFLKLGIIAAFAIGLSACSSTVSADDDSNDKTNSRTSSTTFEYEDSVVVNIDSTKKSSKDSDDEDSEDTSSKSSNNDSDSSDSTDQGIYSSNAPTPVVSAIIFQNNAAKEEYEFELVVHGNYIKHTAVMAADSVIYEFRWNDEQPREWHRIKISDYQPIAGKNPPKQPDVVTDTLINLNKYDMCHSYGSVRVIWYFEDQVEVSEWSDPVGPLDTLTQEPDAGRTEFTFTDGSDNPCTYSY